MDRISYYPAQQVKGADGERLAGITLTLPQIHELLTVSEHLGNATIAYRAQVNQLGAAEAKRRNLKHYALPAVSFGGEFRAYGNEHLIRPSGYAQWDVDDISPADAPALLARMLDSPFFALGFRSPSGKVKGVYRMMPTPKTAHEHLYAVNETRSWIDTLMGVESDKAVSSISKLCYLVHDADAFIQHCALPAIWNPNQTPAMPTPSVTTITPERARIILSILRHLTNQMPAMLADRDKRDDFVLRYLMAWGLDREARLWYEYGQRVANGTRTHRIEPFETYYARTNPIPDPAFGAFMGFAQRFGWNSGFTAQ